jgi:hypothetical protein
MQRTALRAAADASRSAAGGLAIGLEESMDYSAAVGEIWRHHDLSNAVREYVSLVRYATLAASSHNT